MDRHRGTRIAFALATETHVVQEDGMGFREQRRMGGLGSVYVGRPKKKEKKREMRAWPKGVSASQQATC